MKVSENLSITFLVEKPEMSKDGRVPIIVRVTLNGQRTEISLGARIFPDQWDRISSRVKGKSPDAMLLNSQITQIKAKLEKHFFLLTTQHDFVTADMIRRSYKGKLVMPGNPDEPDEKKTFMQAVAFEIGRLKESRRKGYAPKVRSPNGNPRGPSWKPSPAQVQKGGYSPRDHPAQFREGHATLFYGVAGTRPQYRYEVYPEY